MKRVLLVPLDDRPVNTDDPIWMGKLVGENVLLPPSFLLGHAQKPGKPEKLLSWLKSPTKKVDALVLSIDMMIYGGLIASRTGKASLLQVKNRLQKLFQVLQTNPLLPLYLFSVQLRLSISVWSEQDKILWEKLFLYSTLCDPQQSGQAAIKTQLRKLRREIPPQLLRDYLVVRKRNLAIQKQLILTCSRFPQIKQLLFCQEDAARFGLHRAEQATLQTLITKQASLPHLAPPHDHASPSIRFLYGADEAGLALVSRALWDLAGKATPVHLHTTYDPSHSKNSIPRYEGEAITKAVQNHAALWRPWLTLKKTTPVQQILDLFVQGPSSEQRDLFFESPDPSRKPSKTWLKQLTRRLNRGAHAVLADLVYANGGDPPGTNILLAQTPFHRLTAYAGWNTAGNTLGTVLAVGMLSFLPTFQKKAAFTYLIKRLLEDVGYQGLIRSYLHAHLAKKGTNRFSLGIHRRPAEMFVQRELNLFYDLLKRHFKQHGVLLPTHPPRIQLPWSRTFEIELAFG